MRAQRIALVGVIVLLSLVVGVLLGRWSVASCMDLRDDYSAVASDIRSQIQTDIDALDPELVGEAYAMVMSRTDCFGPAEIDEISRLYDLRGPDG